MVKKPAWGLTDSKWESWDLNSNLRAGTLIQSCRLVYHVDGMPWNCAAFLPLSTEYGIESSRLTDVKGREALMEEKTRQVHFRAP